MTILVADDDPDLRDILRSILEAAGYRVLEAPDGAVALESAKKHHPDMLILDYTMPRLEGPQVCEALKRDLLLRHLPIIMLTGRGETQDKVAGINAGADDYLVKPFEPQELLARVRMVLRRTSQELEANPLTKLPGNVSIQREVEERLARDMPIAVCYCDLNHFKAFNDRYGFERGDQVIRLTSQILLEAVKRIGNPADFIGHIGGDDFVVITTPDRAEEICQAVTGRFESDIPWLYDETDRTRGSLSYTDRQGQTTTVGLLSIAIAVVTNRERRLSHFGQVAALSAELKGLAKQLERSGYVIDRRKER